MRRWRERIVRVERAAGRWSPRVAFFLGALVLASSAWVRPPLGRDVSSFSISVMPDAADPAEWLAGPRPVAPDGAGVLLVGLIGIGAVVSTVQPGRLRTVAGLVLAVGLAANAAVVLNHPALVEALDREQEQRALVARVIARSPVETTLTNSGNGRVTSPDGGPICELARGTEYLRFGPWLVACAAIGVYFAGPGSVGRRLGAVLWWSLAGVGMVVIVCLPRLHAEYLVSEAQRLDAEGDIDAGRRALDGAVNVFPELGRTERIWLIAGRIDYRAGRDTPQIRVFRAAQLARRERWAEAAELVNDPQSHPVIRAQAARLWAAAGLDHYARDPGFTDAGTTHGRQDRHLAAARAAWQRGQDADPADRGCAIALGLVEARLNPGRPDLLEPRLAPLLPALADQPLRADLLATLGDAHFEAGDVTAARRRYAESFRAFNLPTAINYRAQAGLGGW